MVIIINLELFVDFMEVDYIVMVNYIMQIMAISEVINLQERTEPNLKISGFIVTRVGNLKNLGLN